MRLTGTKFPSENKLEEEVYPPVEENPEEVEEEEFDADFLDD